MRSVILVMSLMVCAVISATPPRPVISETFEARVSIQVHNGTHTSQGVGSMAVNQPKGMGVEVYDFGFPNGFRIFELERFDISKAFEWDNKARQCRTYNIPQGDTFPPVWAWLANAQYVGQRKFRNFALDFWNYTTTVRGVTLQSGVGVLDTGSSAPSRPVVLGRHWSISGVEQRRDIEFIEWASATPDPKLFNIPRDCSSSSKTLVSQASAPMQPLMPAMF